MQLLAFGFLGLTSACVGALAAPQVDQKVQSQTQSAASAPSFHEEVLGEISPGSSYPQFSRDGKRLAYLGKRGKKWIAVVDGKEIGPELDGYADFGFDPNGNRFYVARAKGIVLGYVVDGVAGPLFRVLSPIAFSSDGKHYAYGGAKQKTGFKKEKAVGTLVLDGQTIAEYEGEGISRLTLVLLGAKVTLTRGVRFAEDEKVISFFARDGMRFLHVTYALTSPPTSKPGREAK